MDLNVKVLENKTEELKLMVNGELFCLKGIIAKSSKTIKALASALLYAKMTDTIFLLGESGVGKEVFFNVMCVANKINTKVNINCSALNDNLLESELFGHKKGSFTDAYIDRQGAFLQASNGVLFLDEIAEMSLKAQAKLLRAIEYKEIKPIGSDIVLQHNAKLVLATNKDLKELVDRKLFRKDLYFRIEGFTIKIPPLRERKEDIMALFEYLSRGGYTISQEAVSYMLEYDWPGNVRELKNAIERAKIKSMFGGTQITLEMLGLSRNKNVSSFFMNNKKQIAEMEKQIIKKAMLSSNNKAMLSKALGVSRSTLYRKIKKFELTA